MQVGSSGSGLGFCLSGRGSSSSPHPQLSCLVTHHRHFWQQSQVDLEQPWAVLTWSDPALPSGFAGIPDPGTVAMGQCLEALRSLLFSHPQGQWGPGGAAQCLAKERYCPASCAAGQFSRVRSAFCLQLLELPPRAMVKPPLLLFLCPKALSPGA